MWEQWRQIIRREWNDAFGNGKPNGEMEDPEKLLARAQEEMRSLHAKNRERAVKAITQKNQLQAMVDDTSRTIANLQEKADLAHARGDSDLAHQLWTEQRNYEENLNLTRQHLLQANECVEQIKAAMRREEEMIRRKTAHALALQAQWKMVQIEQAITLSLAQVGAAGSGGGTGLTREQLQERHERNREYVAEAFTQKRRLEEMVAETEGQVEELRRKADLARRQSDDDTEREVLRRMEQHEATLAQARDALRRTAASADRARDLVQEEAARVRDLTEGLLPSAPPQPRLAMSETDSATELLLLSLLGVALIGCVVLVWWMLRGM